jgi:hypothetical protein
MSGTSGPTQPTPPTGSVTLPVSTEIGNEVGTLIAEGEAEVGTLEQDVETKVAAWANHPDGPFAGIVAWAEAEFAKLRSEIVAGTVTTPSVTPPVATGGSGGSGLVSLPVGGTKD